MIPSKLITKENAKKRLEQRGKDFMALFQVQILIQIQNYISITGGYTLWNQKKKVQLKYFIQKHID